MPLFPNDVSKLLDGPVRVLWGLVAGAVPAPLPTSIFDIIAMVGPAYAPKAGWTDFGSTTDESTYSRDMDSEEYTIEQQTGAVLSRITGVTRQFKLPIAEISPAHMQMLEEGGAITSIASAAGKGAQKKAPFGSIDSLTRYRVAFIAQRDPGFGGVVTEPGGAKRGPFVAVVGYQASLAAEGSELGISRGNLSSRDITFTLYPDSTVAVSNENTGAFFMEDPGTII